MKKFALVALVVLASSALAERPPQFRKDAALVVTGTVEKLTAKDRLFGGDGVMTTYTAKVKVEKAEKGDVKAGDTVEVTWFRVTKTPSRPLAGAYGQDHGLKEKDEATFWVTGDKAPYSVIYNKDGVEKKKK